MTSQICFKILEGFINSYKRLLSNFVYKIWYWLILISCSSKVLGNSRQEYITFVTQCGNLTKFSANQILRETNFAYFKSLEKCHFDNFRIFIFVNLCNFSWPNLQKLEFHIVEKRENHSHQKNNS